MTVRPIRLITGEHHFNEVIFEDVFIPDDMVIGEIGNGWKQGMAELAYERSGPERFLSTFLILSELVNVLRKNQDARARIAVGQLTARLWTLRQMSLGVAGLLELGVTPDIAAALVKDLGTQFEREVTEAARTLVDCVPSLTSQDRLAVYLAEAILHAPGFTLGRHDGNFTGNHCKGVGRPMSGNDIRDMFVDTAGRDLKDVCTKELLEAADHGEWASQLWSMLEESGMNLVPAPEEADGVGGSFADALAIVREAGRFAPPVPLAETLLANWLLSLVGLPVVTGPGRQWRRSVGKNPLC